MRASALALPAAALALGALVPGMSLPAQQPAPTPPVAERRPAAVTLHGDTRTDEYQWLRTKSDPKVAEYLEAENAYARTVLEPTRPLQERLYQEMLGRIKQTDLSVPTRIDG